MKMLFLLIFLLNMVMLNAFPTQPGDKTRFWSNSYQKELLMKAGLKMADLADFPTLQYPNKGYEILPALYPQGKVLLFGYGSLMNVDSASRSMSKEAIESMRPAMAFGLKRIFNYKASRTTHWGENQDPKEKAMLNLIPTTSYKNVVNGVIIEVEALDFEKLVPRETGYDLVPILVTDWRNVEEEVGNPEVFIAYTFIVPDEIREGIDYTQTKYYPVRGYLEATRMGALAFGERFLDFYDNTTYLANGTTLIKDWDRTMFTGELCNKEP